MQLRTVDGKVFSGSFQSQRVINTRRESKERRRRGRKGGGRKSRRKMVQERELR